MSRFYAGIGSRETPAAYLTVMREIGIKLALQGMTLRSGAADGADTAFERGARDAMTAAKGIADPEIYVPQFEFNSKSEQRKGLPHSRLASTFALSGQCVVIAREHHPNWAQLSKFTQWLHTRNVAQVLGADCQAPSEFVLCWTPRGAGTGGTGQAVRVARAYGIPVYDMGNYALPFIRRKLANLHGVQV